MGFQSWCFIVGALAAAVALYGVLAVFAARDDVPWFWRFAPLVLFLAALFPIGGIELIALFGSQAAVIFGWSLVRIGLPRSMGTTVAADSLGDSSRPQPSRVLPRFRLMDLAGLVVLVAVAFALLRTRAPARSAVPLPALLAVGLLWGLGVLVAFAILRAGIRAASRSSARQKLTEPTGQIANGPGRGVVGGMPRIAVLATVLALAAILSPVYRALLPPSIPASRLPSPNGYTELLQISNEFNWGGIPTIDLDITDSQCEQFAREHATVLARLSDAISLPSVVPAEYRPDVIDSASWIAIRNLIQALDMQARAAAVQGETDQVANAALDLIRLSVACSRGGLLTEELIAHAAASIGREHLAEQIPRLDERQLAGLRHGLQPLTSARDPIDVVIERDAIREVMGQGWPVRLSNWATGTGYPEATRQAAYEERKRVDALLALTLLDTAIREYALRNGDPPQELEELLPDYLTTVPDDPFGTGPLKYKRTDSGYLLYSVGANGTDDAGTRVSIFEALVSKRGDLFYDAVDFDETAWLGE